MYNIYRDSSEKEIIKLGVFILREVVLKRKIFLSSTYGGGGGELTFGSLRQIDLRVCQSFNKFIFQLSLRLFNKW